MKHYAKISIMGILSIVIVTCALGTSAFAQGKKAKEATHRSNDAAAVFNEIMGAPDNAIPKELIDKAQAIAVFPRVLKAWSADWCRQNRLCLADNERKGIERARR